ncbi:MAG TPA: hypothetical protein VJM83_00800, partial [Nitrospirota bacterium]|nr:hypothetical protein [Nitrospirota bacterium]
GTLGGASSVPSALNDDGWVVGYSYTTGNTASHAVLWRDQPPVPVGIDIKPDDATNTINLKSAGVIPVAVLGSADFDAATVDPESVALSGAKVKMVGMAGKFLYHDEDINGDGFTDRVFQIYTEQFLIEPGATVAVLTGTTYTGTPIQGEDFINIVQ